MAGIRLSDIVNDIGISRVVDSGENYITFGTFSEELIRIEGSCIDVYFRGQTLILPHKSVDIDV